VTESNQPVNEIVTVRVFFV